MSKISITPNASGTGVFTISSPATSTDRTLTLPDEAGTVLTSASSITQNAGPTFSAYQSTGTLVNNSTTTKILFQTEEWDTNSNYDSSRFTPNVAGYYIIIAAVCGAFGGNSNSEIFKNGSAYKRGVQPDAGVAFVTYPVSSLVYLNGSSDYVEIYFANNGGNNITTIDATKLTYFNGAMVRAA